MKLKILTIAATLALTGCEGMGKRHADSYLLYIAGQVMCMQEDRVVVKSYDRQGNVVSEVDTPAGHCGRTQRPIHEAEILAPAATALGGAAIAATTLIHSDRQQTKRSIRQSEASEFISRENRLSQESMFTTFNSIGSSQQSTIDQLIQELPDIESEGDSMEMGEVGETTEDL